MEYCKDCGEKITDGEEEYCSICDVALCWECTHGDYDEYFCETCYQKKTKPVFI